MSRNDVLYRTKSALRGLFGDTRYERIKIAARRAMGAVGPEATTLAARAEEAWANGDAADAERDWRTLAAMQLRNEEWPRKLAHSAEMQAAPEVAENILQAAWARGARSPEIAERLAFFKRWNRNSNTAIDEAVAIIRDPAATVISIAPAVTFLLAKNERAAAREGIARIAGDLRYGSLERAHAAALSVLEDAQAQGRTPVDGWLSPVRDSLTVREPGADTTVIVCTTIRGDCGMPVNAIHAMLQPARVNTIYLFDERFLFNLDGSTTFGRPYPKMLEGLRARLDAWGTRTLIVIGFSGGGFTALRLGLDLKADGALLFSPVVTLHRRPEWNIEDARGRAGDDARMMFLEKYLRRHVAPMMTQLPDELHHRDCLKTIEIHYGQVLADLVHINEVWSVPGIDFHPVENFPKHEVLSEIVRRRDFDIATRFVARVRAARGD